MLIETVEQRVRLVKPRSFVGLMTLYESNHARLCQMLGNLRDLPSMLISKSPTDLSIYLTRKDKTRYTTTMLMTYWLDGDGGISSDPDLLLRIYHDARLAEAVNCRDYPRHAYVRELWTPGASAFEKRWLLNVLLSKWLEYCLDNCHMFA